MVPEFQNMQELLNYRQSVMVLDLVEQTHRANLAPISHWLKEPPRGIYSKTGETCFVNLDKPTFAAAQITEILATPGLLLPVTPNEYCMALIQRGAIPITSLTAALSAKGGIADAYGRTLFTGHALRMMSRGVTDTPGVKPTQFKLTQMMLQYFLNSMCKYSRMGPHIPFEMVFKPEVMLSDISDISQYFEALHTLVVDFVKEDTLNIYMLDIRSPRAYLEKGMDYRIYDYHEKQFQQQFLDEDAGRC